MPELPATRPAPSELVPNLLEWYAETGRPLPWRRPDTSPWAVLVSEVMLQQTPVARVLPAFEAWLRRWPTPATLAAASPATVLRQWDRLGYPRRALRLQAAAREIVDRHGGTVPDDLAALLALPGVGSYTARAVAVFAFGQRHPVVDTNVRRVLARAVGGQAEASTPSPERDLAQAEALLPADNVAAARTSVAVMELGALVCTARTPRCARCPIRARCRWRRAGSPPAEGLGRRPQPYAGTDRQARGRLLASLRESATPLSGAELATAWDASEQRERALAGLVADGLVRPLPDGCYRLPER